MKDLREKINALYEGKIKLPAVDWVIHVVVNGVKCDLCDGEEDSFIEYACNAHTHGMDTYGHPDFQMVVDFGTDEIGRILNTLGRLVQSGERFQAGDMISGMYEDCPIRLDMAEESNRKVLRVIVPDAKNRFPEEQGCTYPYAIQSWPTDSLYRAVHGKS